MNRARPANEPAPPKGQARRRTPIVQHALFRDQVCEFIRADVRSGVIPPGRRLREVELAARYRVSRTPVREALIQLARDGVVRYAGPGYFAPSVTPNALRETLELKRLLEPAAAAQAAEAATPRGLRLLEQRLLQAQCARKAKPAAFAHAEERFHAALREMCPNASLVRCLVLSDTAFSPVRLSLVQREPYRAASMTCQQDVMRACRGGDGGLARRAMLRLFDDIASVLRRQAALSAASVDATPGDAATKSRKQAYGSADARHEGSAQTSAAGGG